jgi:hypothetical protein
MDRTRYRSTMPLASADLGSTAGHGRLPYDRANLGTLRRTFVAVCNPKDICRVADPL